jgi:hypothetical protein
MSLPTKMSRSNILYWNCASGVYNKKAFIEKYTLQFKPLVFFVSECELHSDQMISLLNLKDYRIEIAGTFESKNKGRLMAFVQRDSASSENLFLRTGLMTSLFYTKRA